MDNDCHRDYQSKPFVPSIRAEFGAPPHRLSQYNIPMKNYTLPIIIERDAEGFYVSCPPAPGLLQPGRHVR